MLIIQISGEHIYILNFANFRIKTCELFQHSLCSLLNRMGKSDDNINIISLTGNFNRLIIKSNCNQRYNC